MEDLHPHWSNKRAIGRGRIAWVTTASPTATPCYGGRILARRQWSSPTNVQPGRCNAVCPVGFVQISRPPTLGLFACSRTLTPSGPVALRAPVLASGARSSNRGGRIKSSPPASIHKKSPPIGGLLMLAGGEGFEPPLTESESVVLPLDDPPANWADRSPGRRRTVGNRR